MISGIYDHDVSSVDIDGGVTDSGYASDQGPSATTHANSNIGVTKSAHACGDRGPKEATPPTTPPPNSGMEEDSSMNGTEYRSQVSMENGNGPKNAEGADFSNSWKSRQVDAMGSVYSRDLPALSNTIIRAPALYVEALPSKKIRHKLADALNIWLRVPEDDLLQIKHVINLLHNASLILDDFEDGSVSRRGRPATHMVFGTAQAINSAGYQINKAMIETMKLGDVRCVDIFSEQMDKLYVGQGHDLFWAFNTKLPSVEEYLCMVDYKTGALFNMLVKLMEAKSRTTIIHRPDLCHLVTLLGRFFQIRDDYMNLTSVEYTDQKGFCEDLDEGKFSLPLIHAIKHAPEAECTILQHVLSQRHVSSAMPLASKHLVLDILKMTRSLDYTKTILDNLYRDIDWELSHVEGVYGAENRILRGLFGLLKIK
ncbi:isoprenoid synthase domain-containing protein [Xylariaceae sp. FL1019]|nr:isoprenoid synthase domain-containing protein [Xylariaceae sp. FL1019]